MANSRFEDLESPFLDAEVLPPVTPTEAELSFEEAVDESAEETDERETVDEAVDDNSHEASEFDGESDEEGEAQSDDEGEGESESDTQSEDPYAEAERDDSESADGYQAFEFADAESGDTDFETESAPVGTAERIDELASQPQFPQAVRDRVAKLLDARKVAEASSWNSAQHPAVSGVSLATLKSRLGRYVDEPGIERAMRDSSTLKDRAADGNAVLAVMTHQFQLKIYAQPAHHDGRLGEGTLDALGFVRHQGDSLNVVDAANVKFHVGGRSKAFLRLQQLYASDRAAFEELGADVTPDTWFRLFVKAPFLGRPFVRGIHFELMRRLRKAETWLLQQPAYRSMSPAEIGAALGIDEDHSGGRAKNNNSMHTLGLAADICYLKNPWVAGQFDGSGKPSALRNGAFKAVTLNVSRLLNGTDEGLTALWLQKLGDDRSLTTAAAHAEIQRRDRDLKAYLALETDPAQLKAAITRRAASNPGESIETALVRWRETIKKDRAKLKSAFGGRRNPANGFMNLHRDLVVALRDHGCLAWGGIDLGRNASGDMMHFDCRAAGIGWKLSLKTQRTAGANHKCATQKPIAERRPVAKRPSPATPPVAESSASVDFLGGRLWTFAARTLPMRIGVFSPRTVRAQGNVDVLVYAHGLLSPCPPVPKKVPRDLIAELPFELGKLIDASKRSIVLVVPFMDWSAVTKNKLGFGRNNHQHLLGKPVNLNGIVAEVLAEVGRELSTSAPALQNLMLAGHSRAYDFLDPLAHAHADPEMSQGALAKLSRVWAFDTTYHCIVDDWTRWLAAKPRLHVHVFYREAPKTRRCGEAFHKAAPASGGRLTVTIAEEGHCAVPKRRLPGLLALPPAPPSPRTEYEQPEGLDETFTGDSDAELVFEDETASSDAGVMFEDETAVSDAEVLFEDETTEEANRAEEFDQASETLTDRNVEECEHEIESREAEPERDDELFDFEDKGTPKAGAPSTSSVNVIVDQPGEADDKYQLVSTDGKYSRTLGAVDAKPLVAGERMLTFTGVNPAKIYKLFQIRSTGSKRLVVLDMPFKDLTEAGHPSRAAKHTFVTLPSQVPLTLGGAYADSKVDPILVARSPQLVDLVVEDPTL